MKDTLFPKYIELFLIAALQNQPSLFAIDICSSHKTPAVLDTFRKHRIMPGLV